jgi:hypothetical protein
VFGRNALANSNISCFSNTAFGSGALQYDTSGNNNTAVGTNALNCDTSGNSNTAVGSGTLQNITTGCNNTGVGQQALFHNVTGFNNTSMGDLSLYYNTNSNNTAFGQNTGMNDISGNYNTYLGVGANTYTSANIYNNSTAIGANALIDASNQIMLGGSNSSGTYPNVVIPSGNINLGICSIYSTTVTDRTNTQTTAMVFDPNSNISVSGTSGISGMILTKDVIFGIQSIYANIFNGDLVQVATSNPNSYLFEAYYHNSTVNLFYVDNSGNIGYIFNGSNTWNIDHTGTCIFNGGLVIGANSSNNPNTVMDVSGNIGVTGNISATGSITSGSDYRIKENVTPLDDSFTIDNLRPVTYKHTVAQKQDIGFIAHEVQEVFPFLVNGEKDGVNLQTLNYTGLIGILVKEIQDLKKHVKLLEEKMNKI